MEFHLDISLIQSRKYQVTSQFPRFHVQPVVVHEKIILCWWWSFSVQLQQKHANNERIELDEN
jgi:hypothetical protein